MSKRKNKCQKKRKKKASQKKKQQTVFTEESRKENINLTDYANRHSSLVKYVVCATACTLLLAHCLNPKSHKLHKLSHIGCLKGIDSKTGKTI